MGIDDKILPSNVPANMYVLLKGRQFSKSSGWYIDAIDAVKDFGEDRMRYYLTTIIPERDDTNFTWEDFAARVNGELVDNMANFCHRTLVLASKFFSGSSFRLEDFSSNICLDVIHAMNTFSIRIRSSLDSIEFRKTVAEILRFTQQANKFVNDSKPWQLIKEDANVAREAIAAALLYMCGLGSFLQPILPKCLCT